MLHENISRAATEIYPTMGDLKLAHRQFIDLLSDYVLNPKAEKTSGTFSAADFFRQVRHFVIRCEATGVVLDRHDDRRVVQGFIDYWVTILYRFDRPEVLPAKLKGFSKTHLLESANKAFAQIDPHLRVFALEILSSLAKVAASPGKSACRTLKQLAQSSTKHYFTSTLTELVRSGLVRRCSDDGDLNAHDEYELIPEALARRWRPIVRFQREGRLTYLKTRRLRARTFCTLTLVAIVTISLLLVYKERSVKSLSTQLTSIQGSTTQLKTQLNSMNITLSDEQTTRKKVELENDVARSENTQLQQSLRITTQSKELLQNNATYALLAPLLAESVRVSMINPDRSIVLAREALSIAEQSGNVSEAPQIEHYLSSLLPISATAFYKRDIGIKPDGPSPREDPDPIEEAAMSPDGRSIVAGTKAGELLLLAYDGDSRTLTLQRQFKLGSVITAISFSSDGKRVAALSKEALFIWQLNDGVETTVKPRATEGVATLSFMTNDTPVIAEVRQERLHIVDAIRNATILDAGRATRLPAMGIFADERWPQVAIFEEAEQRIGVVDLNRHVRAYTLSGLRDARNIISTSNRHFVGGISNDGTVVIWDVSGSSGDPYWIYPSIPGTTFSTLFAASDSLHFGLVQAASSQQNKVCYFHIIDIKNQRAERNRLSLLDVPATDKEISLSSDLTRAALVSRGTVIVFHLDRSNAPKDRNDLDDRIDSQLRELPAGEKVLSFADYLALVGGADPNLPLIFERANMGDERGTLEAISRILPLHPKRFDIPSMARARCASVMRSKALAIAATATKPLSDEITGAIQLFGRAEDLSTTSEHDPRDLVMRTAAAARERKGNELADAGMIDDATAQFLAAKDFSPTGFPYTKDGATSIATWRAAASFAQQSVEMAKRGSIEEALSAVKQTEQFNNLIMYPQKRADIQWNKLCWWIALWGGTERIEFAIDRISLDARGLVLATQKKPQWGTAIEAFEAASKKDEAELYKSDQIKRKIEQRNRWILDLRRQKNPFDSKLMEALRNNELWAD